MRVLRAVCIVSAALLPLASCAGKQSGLAARRDLDRLHDDRDAAVAGMEKGKRPPPEGRPAPVTPSAEPGTSPAAARKGYPDWVTTGISDEYPLEAWITGIGSAESRSGQDHTATAVADDRARSEIAKSIRVRIRAEFENAAKLVTEARSGTIVVEKDTTSVANQIASQTDLVLDGVQIAKRWRDEQGGVLWSLAVMNRAVAAAAIRDRMERLREELARDREIGLQARRQGRSFQAAASLNRAVRTSLSLLAYRAQLRAIAPASADASVPLADHEMVALWREAALAQEAVRVVLVVFVQVDGKRSLSPLAQVELARQLRASGLNVVHAAVEDKATYAEFRNMSIADMRRYVGERGNGLLLAEFAARQVAAERMVALTAHFYQARAEAMLIDLEGDRIVASAAFDWSATTHSGHPDPARAAEESLVKAALEIAALLKAEIGPGFALSH